jgi:GntP family gluconate:H+ symporter
MWLLALLVLSIVFIVLATTRLKLHPFLALLLTAFGFGILSGMPLKEVVDSVNQGFGGTIGYIGIVILAGAIIGAFLEKSGGAYRLATSILKLTGQKQVPTAMAGMGYIVSIPVFCDSAFVLLSPLMRALASKAGITLASAAVALSLGLYATHTMVPPTPGPVAAAGILGADLGLVILWGMLVALVSLIAGWLFAVLFASRTYIAPEPGPGVDEAAEAAAEQVPEAEQPTVLRSLLPIFVPILLIVARSISELPTRPFGEGGLLLEILGFIGQPVVALLLGVGLAMTLPKRFDRQMLSMSGWVGEAIVGAGTIIIITGAGGAFGKVLQNSGIADVIGGALVGSNLGIWLPFLIAAGIKTAQGSSTVAIITTAGLVAPLLASLGLDGETQKALVVIAIGAGAMVVSHANDSYFWVVTQFSGMDVKTGYRLQTLGTLVQGTTAALAVYLLSLMIL